MWETVAEDGEVDIPSAVALQVQAAWLRPNLLRLLHTWLLQADEGQADEASRLLLFAWDLLFVQLAPTTHPLRMQLGATGGPALSAAMAAVGDRGVANMQVGAGKGRQCVVQ
jgi:hypothetical protein